MGIVLLQYLALVRLVQRFDLPSYFHCRWMLHFPYSELASPHPVQIEIERRVRYYYDLPEQTFSQILTEKAFSIVILARFTQASLPQVVTLQYVQQPRWSYGGFPYLCSSEVMDFDNV